ncbi:choice-of-anchor L domain-containing protein [Nostoc sp. FACHB-152]|uniref:choice-of-anchor L domain-containing protein n=1 Tax=unclassified Nostoc TaxID=2593658 RepID=UPI00168607A5|nr:MULTISPECIES: choice-of-anchor L domain-containing protein [unclassified Nostoc]MBD2447072.1 choice-of-anchor L domain-containing protein [Nostoc sp. FACHB-152]MBD2470355.1 choice-of-anchor L domain-containing protein [Nostoc sp. FACHB-145]
MKSLKNVLKNSALSLLGLGLLTAPAHAVNITTSSDANVLVNQIVGSGITVYNAKYHGAPLASGIFKGGIASGLGIDTGIILTTGDANLAVGPNDKDNATKENGLLGDTNLNSLIPPGSKTLDASILEFDFTSSTDEISFNYVFASEEYNEYVNSSYNDVFGFFLNGKNIALIPGTTKPVSINNVNGGKPLNTNATNPQFFNNNDLSDGGPFYNIQYDGFTKVFTAKAKGLTVGELYHLKLAIADVEDFGWDSAVFIQAGTFSSKLSKTVPEPTSVLGILAFGAVGASSYFKRKQKASTKA